MHLYITFDYLVLLADCVLGDLLLDIAHLVVGAGGGAAPGVLLGHRVVAPVYNTNLGGTQKFCCFIREFSVFCKY